LNGIANAGDNGYLLIRFDPACARMAQKPHFQIITAIGERLAGYKLDALAMRVQSVNKSLILREGEEPWQAGRTAG
jgi:hypothetical protein